MSALSFATSHPVAVLARRLPSVSTVACRRTQVALPTISQLPFPASQRKFAQLRSLGQRPAQGGNKEDPSSAATDKTESTKPKQSVLDRMGATRNVKIAVIVFLCIYGTMETIFYASAFYRWLTKKSE